jgi:hypothetical protein
MSFGKRPEALGPAHLPSSSGFLNRVCKFDSCRGHHVSIAARADRPRSTQRSFGTLPTTHCSDPARPAPARSGRRRFYVRLCAGGLGLAARRHTTHARSREHHQAAAPNGTGFRLAREVAGRGTGAGHRRGSAPTGLRMRCTFGRPAESPGLRRDFRAERPSPRDPQGRDSRGRFHRLHRSLLRNRPPADSCARDPRRR